MNGPLVNSLTQSDISSRATVLDIYLSQLAVKNRKRVSAVETVQEQCSPLNQLNNTLVRFCQGMHIYGLFNNSVVKKRGLGVQYWVKFGPRRIECLQ